MKIQLAAKFFSRTSISSKNTKDVFELCEETREHGKIHAALTQTSPEIKSKNIENHPYLLEYVMQ